ncbi:family 2 putative glycosyltransferase [Podospora australis]|uniref:Family 2 putative glycosyltransferase n=1 Tax=Podospora australis TaxID=1536484 RepID=A0AAN6WN33_9PEZI|nr:family 2 putative glycosyltransferase [Podospora australis]
MIPKEKIDRDGDHRDAVIEGHFPSTSRMFLNFLGCLLAIPVYYFSTVHSRYPVTLDIVITIALTELNRYIVERRRADFARSEQQLAEETRSWNEKEEWSPVHLETQPLSAAPRLECLAAVVGWREDPALYTRALESYKSARTCAFFLAGIDGDEAEDQDMVTVFSQVFPDHSAVIHVPEPLGEVAERIRDKTLAIQRQQGQSINVAEAEAVAMQTCLNLARTILNQHNIQIGTPNGIRQLCLKQRHMHKKGIMFTAYVFSLIIADILGIEFMWSSDSDTIVFPDSLEQTINSIASDPKAGGASSGLVVHNSRETAVTSLASAVYWGELYLTRSTPACTGTSDCQSGPSTAFRLAALPAILVPWYLQVAFGKRMIVNEDRHLTTNLLLRGWNVIFASDTLAATDTPTTMARWLKQQVRWARATHIESLLRPKVYILSHPLLFYGMVKREFGPAIGAFAVMWYFFTSHMFITISVMDFVYRIMISSAYNFLRNPHRLTQKDLVWTVPGVFFYYIPLPAVQIYSMLTMAADGWGTSMRASGDMERAKRESRRKAWFELGFFVVWMSIVAGVIAKALTSYYGFVWHERMAATLVAMGAAGFAAWKITIGAQ